MAINRIDYPTVPYPVTNDWDKAVQAANKAYKNVNDPLQFLGTVVPKGAVFNFGGVIYEADSDTTITGTQSNYVKLTPSTDGLTLSASFVSSLAGVAWNSIRNNYFDPTGNMYIFSEADADYDNILTDYHFYNYPAVFNSITNDIAVHNNGKEILSITPIGLVDEVWPSTVTIVYGMAFDNISGHLILISYINPTTTVYVIQVEPTYSLVTSFTIDHYGKASIDPSGNLCIVQDQTVYRYVGISATFDTSITFTYYPRSIDFDSSGNLITYCGDDLTLRIYSGFSTSLTNSYTNFTCANISSFVVNRNSDSLIQFKYDTSNDYTLITIVTYDGLSLNNSKIQKHVATNKYGGSCTYSSKYNALYAEQRYASNSTANVAYYGYILGVA